MKNQNSWSPNSTRKIPWLPVDIQMDLSEYSISALIIKYLKSTQDLDSMALSMPLDGVPSIN